MPQQTTSDTVVKVYVRLGAGENTAERDISFRIPEQVDALELLAEGFAIDGRNALVTISQELDLVGIPWYMGAFDEREATLAKALAQTQRQLAEFFKERGLTVQFV